jgi:hypothetical protein
LPRPGEVSAPLYQGLPYGQNSLVNDLSEEIPDEDDPTYDELADFVPQGVEEEFLFSGTDRPDEPVTTGMSFGAGADFSRYGHESNKDLLNRVATTISSDPAASKEVRAFAERVKRGY